jgi:pre-mRNA-processing factor SLU7
VSRVIAEQSQSVGDDDLNDDKKTRSRDDFKKQKELEEQRKLGNEPAAVDESGKDINPHIPQYISEAPWYLDPDGPTLRHQRQQEGKYDNVVYSGIDEWYKKGVNTTSINTKYKKGACENCGALTHKKRDCVERPRKVGAKYTGSNLAPDEFLQPNLNLTYDGKRDRWNGYENIAHKETIEEYEKLEDVKRDIKKERYVSTSNCGPTCNE